ncbi:hypothetical protein SBF1_320010 [Candidatus Desulfosporosinus infrequens]|uniref:Uncharacterized protein n=1 Tax=Candidatus Desulfosporosinus infrequens TaxID=2043169 RepID=A0A2U3KZN2_9FIRM|nr:hypothetical protein SBF1_320010 [Candidatus Desulfosporosinus infrequens]
MEHSSAGRTPVHPGNGAGISITYLNAVKCGKGSASILYGSGVKGRSSSIGVADSC